MKTIGKFVASEVISSCPSVGRTAILNAIKNLLKKALLLDRETQRTLIILRIQTFNLNRPANSIIVHNVIKTDEFLMNA